MKSINGGPGALPYQQAKFRQTLRGLELVVPLIVVGLMITGWALGASTLTLLLCLPLAPFWFWLRQERLRQVSRHARHQNEMADLDYQLEFARQGLGVRHDPPKDVSSRGEVISRSQD